MATVQTVVVEAEAVAMAEVMATALATIMLALVPIGGKIKLLNFRPKMFSKKVL